MNKNLGIAILIIALTFTVGCSSGSILKPTPTSSIPTLAQQILSQSISTMANITSCSLNIDVQEPYTFICTNERQCGDMYTNISQWNGTKISQWNGTEITNQNESVIMINESPYGGQVIPCETYAADGRWWVVGASYLNDSYSGQWAPNDQYPQQINLMKTAINASLASDEIVDGVNCYILNLVPSRDAVINWVSSLSQPCGGLSMEWWWAGPTKSQEIYSEAYNNSSSVTVWIDKSNYRVIRINISASFEVLPEYISYGDMRGSDGDSINASAPCTPELCGFTNINESFYSQIDFSNFNKSFSVPLLQ